MLPVLRASVLLAIVAVVVATTPSFAQSASATSDAASASCSDGYGGRWAVERARVADALELRLVHTGIDGTRRAPVVVRRADAARGIAAELRCDARGGAWIAWTEIDYFGTSTEVRAAHVSRDGAVLSRGDVALASFQDLYDAVSLLPDGRGGAYVAWREADAKHDRHVKLNRLAADGRAEAGWPANGLQIDPLQGNVRAHLVTDGEGGAIVVADPDPNRAGSAAFALRVSPTAALLR